VDSIKEFERERNRIRQEKVSKRRKESGLIAKRLQFTKYDIARIEKLALHMGYDPDKLRLEDISGILGYCIAITSEHEKIVEKPPKPNNKQRLYRYKVRNVIKHQLRIKKRAKNKYQKVAEFLIASKYPLPEVASKTLRSIPRDQQDYWCEAWIKALVPE